MRSPTAAKLGSTRLGVSRSWAYHGSLRHVCVIIKLIVTVPSFAAPGGIIKLLITMSFASTKVTVSHDGKLLEFVFTVPMAPSSVGLSKPS